MTLRSGLPRDFVEAGRERLRDARALLDARAKRWDGAIYLARYAVECLLKARICGA